MQTKACTTYTYTASISPTSTDAGLTGVPYAVTFTDTSSSKMGSGTITIPTGYTAVSLTSVTASNGQSWSGSISSSTISFKASHSHDRITAGQTVTVVFSATNPSSAGSYTWKTKGYSDTGESGTAFTLSGSQPTVTVNPAPTVSVSPSSWTMDVGQSTAFTATATGGSGTYTSYQWYVNAVAQSGSASMLSFTPGSSGSYLITVRVIDSLGATSALSSAATVAVNQLTITVTQTANGVISPGTSNVNYGATPSFTITPNTDYHIASITADGASVTVTSPSGQTYQFNPVSADGSLTATFAINTYTITVTSAYGNPTASASVNAGNLIYRISH